MPGTRTTTQLPGGDVAVQFDQLLTATGVTDWTYLSGRVEIQCTGAATSVTVQPERSTVDPALAANPAPVGAAVTGNPSTGMQVIALDEAGAAWWRLRVTALTGASVAVSLGGRGATTPATIVQDRTPLPQLQRLSLAVGVATAGTVFVTEILGKTAGTVLRLENNPGERWSLSGTTLTGRGLRQGIETPSIVEVPGTSGALGPRESEFRVQVAHDPAIPAWISPATLGDAGSNICTLGGEPLTLGGEPLTLGA